MARRCSQCGHNGHNSRTCLEMKESPENPPRTLAKETGEEDEEKERNRMSILEGGGGFKLFGVRFSSLDSRASVLDSSPISSSSSSSSSSTQMRKSVSMGNLSNYGLHDQERVREGIYPSPAISCLPDVDESVEGYASDDLVHSTCSSRGRKKAGVPWTEEEHRDFLLGLEKLGKGDWRGISRKFVKSRTPTQVASHAQKYFLRRNNLNKRRRRSSLFDITADTVSRFLSEPLLEEPDDVDTCPELSLGQTIQYGNDNGRELARHSWRFSKPPLQHMPMVVESIKHVCKVGSMDTIDEMDQTGENHSSHGSFGVDTMVSEESNDRDEISDKSLRFQFRWSPISPNDGMSQEPTKIVKPTPVVVRPNMKLDNTKILSDLGMEIIRPMMAPTPLSYQLLEEGSRHSAFHTTTTANSTREIDEQVGLQNAISVP